MWIHTALILLSLQWQYWSLSFLAPPSFRRGKPLGSESWPWEFLFIVLFMVWHQTLVWSTMVPMVHILFRWAKRSAWGDPLLFHRGPHDPALGLALWGQGSLSWRALSRVTALCMLAPFRLSWCCNGGWGHAVLHLFLHLHVVINRFHS